MSVYLLSTALALLAGAPAPSTLGAAALALVVDTTSPADSGRALARQRARVRRDSLRAEIARLRASCGNGCDGPDGFDGGDLSGIGRVVSESVSAGVRGAADGIRRATTTPRN